MRAAQHQKLPEPHEGAGTSGHSLSVRRIRFLLPYTSLNLHLAKYYVSIFTIPRRSPAVKATRPAEPAHKHNDHTGLAVWSLFTDRYRLTEPAMRR